MKISAAGVELIRSYETFAAKAYLCPAGVWTIGFGHTGPDVFKGRTVTRAEAETLLHEDIAEKERDLARLVSVAVTQPEWDALVSLVFNIGAAAFRRSTVRRRLNAGDDAGAAAGFDLFIKHRDRKTGKLVRSNGLVRRRAEEKALFLKGAARPGDTAPETMPQEIVESAPIKEVRENLAQSRTMAGGVAATTGVTGAGAIETIQDAQDQLSPVIGYLDIALYAFLALAFAGALVTVWARWSDWKKGRR